MNPKEIFIQSTIDNTLQPSLFFEASEEGKRPLLVGLHTWSFDRHNQINNMLPYSQKYGFHLLLPEFRGPNLISNSKCTEACGSHFAKQDIKDAIDYLIQNYDIDKQNIFLLGLSGGGHMAMLMAGYCPEYFKAIGSFVPISDLREWKVQNPRYAEHITACCSNDPEEMMKRSPISYMETISKANLKIFHGKYDTTVPVVQSINFYNQLYQNYPQSRVFLDIFDGGHEINMETAMSWILSQYTGTEKVMVTG